MGIDKFINDYFDGTLTPEDDKKFRDLLENNLEAREEFDLMLSIHSILKDDAESITVPKQLEEKVEQRLLASYLKIVSSQANRKNRRFVYALAFIVVLFFLTIFNIDDGRVVQNRSYFVSELLKQSSFLEEQVPLQVESEELSTFQNSKSLSRPISTQNEHLKVTDNNISSIELTGLGETTYPQNLIAVTEGFINKEELLNFNENRGSGFAVGSILQDKIYSEYLGSTVPFKFNIKQMDNSQFFANEFTTQGIALTGFSSLPVKKFGYNKENLKSFSSFSQSVGYRIGNNFRLGLEFGYFDFDYVQNTTILVPAIQSSAPERKIYTKSTDRKDNEAIILQNGEDFSYPSYVKVTVPIEKKYQQYWGSLFIDYEYPLSDYFSVVGRINIGATSEGFLGGVRMYTEFRPVNGISFNIGVENKSYLDKVQNETSSLKSIFSVVYGLSIKFDFNR